MIEAFYSWDIFSFLQEQEAVEFETVFRKESSIDFVIQQLSLPRFQINDFEKYKSILTHIYITNVHNLDGLNNLTNAIMKCVILSDSPHLFIELMDLIDINTLRLLASMKFEGLNFEENQIQKRASEFEDILIQESQEYALYSEFKKIFYFALAFTGNVLDLFFDTLYSLGSNKTFYSIFDKQLLLDIICKYLLIPYALTNILESFFDTTIKLHVVVLCILAVGTCFLAMKQFFEWVPNDIVNCVNLNSELELGKIKPKFGRSIEISKIVTGLLAEENILIVGKSGEGKTAMVHELVQLNREGKFKETLGELHFFSLHCGFIMSSRSFGHNEMINQTRKQMDGIEKKSTLFIDEIDQIAANSGVFQAFKEGFFNDDGINPLCIAATTEEGLSKLEKLDIDGSFLGRMKIIRLEEASEEQCRRVLNEFVIQKASDLPVDLEALDKVVEYAMNSEFLPLFGRLKKIKKIMKNAVGRCKFAYSSNSTSLELMEKQEQYDVFKSNLVIDKKITPAILLEKEKFRENIEHLTRVSEERDDQICEIKKILEHKNMFFQQRSIITQALAYGEEEALTEENQKKFLFYQTFGAEVFQSSLQEIISPIENKENLVISSQLIDAVFLELNSKGA